MKKDSFHYIPMEAALRNLLEDKSYQRMEKHQRNDDLDKIVDIQDGSSFKDKEFFKMILEPCPCFSIVMGLN